MKPQKTENLKKNLRKTYKVGLLGELNLRETLIKRGANLGKIERVFRRLSAISARFFESVRDYINFLNLRFNLRKIEGGGSNHKT